ncbi:MAG TPA: FAD-dependent oxidoreductase [Thermoleophilaceae bacterium]
MSRALVVGGGPAGCAAAYGLRRRGHEVTLVEAAPELGGRAWTLRDGDFTIDTGAFYVCNFYRRTLELIDELGRRDRLVPMPRETGLYDRERGRWRWVVGSPVSLLRFPGLGVRDKLRVAAGFRAKSLSRLDAHDTEALAAADTGETVADWSRRVLGERGFEAYIRPSFEPWWLFECERGAATVLTSFIPDSSGMELLAIRGGTDSLCHWLADGVEVRCGAAATALEVGQHGVEVELEGGETVGAEVAVVATDAHAAAGLVPDERTSQRLAGVGYAAVTHVSLVYERGRWGDRPYSTHPARPGRHRAGTVARVAGKLAESVPPGADVIDVYFNDRASRSMGEDDAVAAARDEAAEFLGAEVPEPVRSHVFARERAIVVPGPGHYAEMVKVRRELPARLRLAGDYFSVTVVESAIRSGDRAARELGAAAAVRAPAGAASPAAA